MKTYKLENYNSLSPYLIVDNAQELADLLKTVFNASELRLYKDEKGKIRHLELLLDDSVLMLADSMEGYPANKTMLHFYVPDVHKTFNLAIQNGCKILEEPIQKAGDEDIRGGFLDLAGNAWYVSSQSEKTTNFKSKH